MDSFNVIVEYIDNVISDDSNNMLQDFYNICEFISIIEENLSIDFYIKLLNNSKKLNNILKYVLTNNKREIKKIDKNEVASSIIETYCSENGIDIFKYIDDEKIIFLKGQSSSDLYLNEIKNNDKDMRVLSKEEELELFRKFELGDEKAKEKLITHNLRLVIYIARKFHQKGMSFDDIVQDGNLGLLKAIEKFDPQRGYKFSTYASYWIRQSISRGISDKSRNIRIPVHRLESLNKYRKDKAELENEFGRIINCVEASELLDLDLKKIIEFETLLEDTTSLDSETGMDSETTLLDYLPDPDKNVEDEVCNKIIHDFILDMIYNKLNFNDHEKYVIINRFGLEDGVPKTLSEIGKTLKVTRERIRQIEGRAIRKIKKSGYAKILAETSDYSTFDDDYGFVYKKKR